MKSIRIPLLLSIVLFAVTASAQEQRVPVAPATSEPMFAARVGLGSMVNPEIFGMTASFEGMLSPFFSIGPMLQAGFGNHETLVVPSLSFRLIVPRKVLKERMPSWPDLEFSLHTGFGGMIRDQDGFRFYSFAYQVGLNADYYLMDHLAVGLGASAIVTSSTVQTAAGLLYASLAYSF